MPKKRLSVIAKENEVSFDEALQLAKDKLPEEEITGKGLGLWISEIGQDILVEAFDIPELTPKMYRGVVHSKAPNRSYIYAYIGEIKKKVPVVIPRRMEDWLTPGKRIDIEAIEDSKGVSYRYVKFKRS